MTNGHTRHSEPEINFVHWFVRSCDRSFVYTFIHRQTVTPTLCTYITFSCGCTSGCTCHCFEVFYAYNIICYICSVFMLFLSFSLQSSVAVPVPVPVTQSLTGHSSYYIINRVHADNNSIIMTL